MTGPMHPFTGGAEAGPSLPPPAVLLPEAAPLFDRRAKRLAAWADGHAMGDFLAVLSRLADAQRRAVATCAAPSFPAASELTRSAAHGMPLLPCGGRFVDPGWREALAAILADMSRAALPEPAKAAVAELAGEDAARLDARAAAFLGGHCGNDLAAMLFVAAALQVAWTRAAAALDPALARTLDHGGLCPVCGSAPVASVIMAAAPLEGSRYLQCGLCGTAWHLPRTQCSHCRSEKDVAYLSLDGVDGHARAEICGDCLTYLKVFAEDKSPGTEAFADDLATVGLDLRLAEDGWHRNAANPFLLAVPVGA